MENKAKLKLSDLLPIAALALITTVITVLLVVMERGMQADENEISGKLREICVELMGEGEFTVADGFFTSGGGRIEKIELPREINKIIMHDESGAVAFQVVVNGYNRNGLNLLIVMNDDGSVKDLAVYINTETPQIGTKVNERDFLDNFVGRGEEVRVVRGTSRSDNEVAAITGATRSARAVADAVNIAIYAYDLMFLGGGQYEQEH
ncbi:MAG: FMN-binding protein [Oscillospiraceae bacterium]|nr:FMN-binding protein [Oscillospiraceae bacterium]